MSSIIKVNTIQDIDGNNIINESGNVITIGASGDTITVPAGATLSGDLNASNLTSGTVPDARITGTYTGITGLDLTDNSKIRLGTGNDLEISHDGSHSYIEELGTGNLFVNTNGAKIALISNSDTSGGKMAEFNADSSVELHFDGSQKFATTSDGIAVTGGQIRTNSSSSTLSIQGGSTYPGAKIQMAGGQASSNPGTIIFSTDDGNVSNVSERARIDADGNFLVGKTNQTANVSGTEIEGSGTIVSTRDNNTNMFLNRKTSDGQLINFRKDNSVVGSIGTASGKLNLGTENCQIRFRDDLTALTPANSDGSNSDNDIDLGYSTIRWRRLYLSEGVFLGGTGTSNKLDDYEQGTFTPVLEFGNATTGITYNNRDGMYVKVGELVMIQIFIELSNKGSASGDATISGLPFTIRTLSTGWSGVGAGSMTWTNFASRLYSILTNPNRNTQELGISGVSNSSGELSAQALNSGDFNNNTYFGITVSYRTT